MGGEAAPLTAEALMAAGTTETPGTIGAAGGLAPAAPGFFSSLASSFGQRPDAWMRVGSALLPRQLQPLASMGAGVTELGMKGDREQEYLAALSVPEAQRTADQRLTVARGAPRQASDIAGSMAGDIGKVREQAQQARQDQAKMARMAPPQAAMLPFRPPASLAPLAATPQSTMKADPMTVLLQRLLGQQPGFLS